MNKPYRLGLDLGTNSIGWTMLEISDDGRPAAILRMGSRIFSDGRDPKSGQSLAADRTSIRGQRTRRDRAVQRRDALLRRLCSLGLLPQDGETSRNLLTLNPYELRAAALTRPLHPYHLGRALMHLAKRRGFQSNRRTPDKDEEGNTKEAARHLQELLEGQTLGQFLLGRIKQGLGARFRPRPESASKPKRDFEFYPLRAMYAAEFAAIRDSQAAHQKLNPEDWLAIERLIFFQRPLRTPLRGRCRFLPEERADLALPSFQRFRILSDANHLSYRPDSFATLQPLTPVQRETVVALLSSQKTVAFGKLRTKLQLPETARFNLESDRREELLGDPIAHLFSGKTLFGKNWAELPLEARDAIVSAVLNTEDHETLRQKGVSFGLTGAALDAFVEINPDKLPKGTARFSATALRMLVPHLEKGLNYSDAVAACGWNHTQAAGDGSEAFLPYYGRAMPDSVVPAPKSKVEDERSFGRFPNPTVHIALNQLRLVVNTLIERFGKPAEIHLEIARNLKMSAKQLAELERQQKDNTKANAARDVLIEQINAEHGLSLTKNYDNRLRLRLWQELSKDPNLRCCPYTGERITPAKLFSHEVEIDHILPFAQTLDDSPANKVLCMRSANRIKRRRSPFEAFGHNPPGYDYDEILNRAVLLPGNKRWRFQDDAMQNFRDEQGFLARQLVDTQHLGRAAHRYLTSVVPPDRVRVSPGRVTALLRHHLGLETLLIPDDAPDRIGKNFRAEAKAAVEAIIVSHRPDHNPAGRLHEETAYGEVLQDPALRRPNQLWEIEKGYNLVVRKPVAGLKLTDIEKVRDHVVRQKLAECLDGLSESDKAAWAEALARFSSSTGTRSVRVLIKDKSARRVTHGDGRFSRLLIPGDVHSVTFWKMPNGSLTTTALTVWEANVKSPTLTKPHPAAKKIFSVCKGDILRTLHKGSEKTVRVFSIRPSEGNELLACCPVEASATSTDQVFIRFNRLEITRTRLLHVSPIGEVRDPGPPINGKP
jgi:CRISPR-associated endonuclease Csn1